MTEWREKRYRFGLHIILSLYYLSAAVPARAASNIVTITEKAGVSTTNYPIQIGRPFVQGEMFGCPQVILNGAPVATQADIKNRWPDNSIKFVILSFLIPQLNANATVNVTFQDQSSCNNTPLTKTQMLAANFDFDAQMVMTGGINATPSARQMLTDWDSSSDSDLGPVKLWTKGPIATTLILADHSTARRYDVGSDANKSFRPIFHATFWPAINRVRIRFIGEIAHTEALQDQAYSLALKMGMSNPSIVYTNTNMTHTACSRWTKEFWLGGQPGTVNINPNAAYLSQTTFIPNYDPAKIPSDSDIQSSYAGWLSRPRDFYCTGNPDYCGSFAKYMPGTGQTASDYIAILPGWGVRWMMTGDWRMKEQSTGNADLAANFPIHLREGKTGRFFDRAHAFSALGRVLSIISRPTIRTDDLSNSHQYTSAADLVNLVGNISNAGFSPDDSHHWDGWSVPYLLTGDYWDLEELYFWAAYGAGLYGTGDSWTRGAPGMGGLTSQIRGQAWLLRTRAHAAFLAPDNSAEKSYLKTLMDDALSVEEGGRNITGTPYQGNAAWTWGRTVSDKRGLAGSPLHTVGYGDSSFMTNLDPAVTADGGQGWEWSFFMTVVGRVNELGFPAGPLLHWLAPWTIGQLTDPGYNPYLISEYQMPVSAKATNNWFTTWSGVRSGFVAGERNITSFTANVIYAVVYYGSASFLTGEPSGQAAWTWIQSKLAGHPELAERWALLPRATSSSSPNPCDVNRDSQVNVTDVQSCVNQALGTVPCTTGDVDKSGTCNVMDVQRVVNGVLGGTCP